MYIAKLYRGNSLGTDSSTLKEYKLVLSLTSCVRACVWLKALREGSPVPDLRRERGARARICIRY